MTTYKDIHGTKVEVRDDDPANPVNGQVWYNSGTLKGFKSNPVGSWATAANLNTTRYDGAVSMAGSKSSALFAGGYVSGIVANVETWNGTAWTEIADIPAATYAFGGTGASSTSALVFGGQNPGAGSSDKTYEWSGSSWAEGGDLNTEFIEFANSVKIDCVIGAANNQLENNIIEKNLFDMGITFCPDYCVNAGGVIILALRSSIKEDMEYLDTEAKNKLIGIKNQLIKILTLSKEKNQLTTVSSNELAEAGFQ